MSQIIVDTLLNILYTNPCTELDTFLKQEEHNMPAQIIVRRSSELFSEWLIAEEAIHTGASVRNGTEIWVEIETASGTDWELIDKVKVVSFDVELKDGRYLYLYKGCNFRRAVKLSGCYLYNMGIKYYIILNENDEQSGELNPTCYTMVPADDLHKIDE